MACDEFFRLDEHSARTTARIEYTAFIRLEHFHQQFNNTARGIELTAFFTFGKGEFPEEIFKYMAENIGTAGFSIAKSDVSDKVYQSAKTGWVKVSACKDFWQNILKRGIFLFDRIHRIVNLFADARELCFGQEIGPAGDFGDKEYIFRLVFVLVFRVGPGIIALPVFESAMQIFKGIGYVFQKNQAKDNVLVFCGINVFAELIGCFPKLFFNRLFFCAIIIGLCHLNLQSNVCFSSGRGI